MKPQTISAIHDFSLEARDILEKEVSGQLEGIYGLLPDGKWAPPEKYPAIQKLPEARETRDRLAQFLDDERAAGLKPKEAREKIVKETAFTWLNRLVAFKMMESRKLLRQTVSKGPQSNGFLMWLTEPGNEEEYPLYEQGDLPQNDIGEGPRHQAYRHFILYHCTELSKEIRVLFDPSNLPTRLFPRPRTLATLIEKMNAAELDEAWAPGNEESIGWIYQFFNEREKKEVFERLYKKKQKIRREDVPAATELFTPHWMVKWLIQNSLGRYWMQMHQDSSLPKNLDYLVPLSGEIPAVPLKKAKEIKFLDLAYGTMHFGLAAFDLFVEMYREEREKAGTEGWPAEPSVLRDEDIPFAIMANNIHGIDIDLRAAQLSALTLFLKAKSLNRNMTITESHLACADVTHFDEARLSAFLRELKLTDSIYARILKGIWEELGKLPDAGSLVRLEQKLKALVNDERAKFRKEQKTPYLPGFSPDQFETEAGEKEFWEIIETQILQALDFFARSQAEKGFDQSFFTGEVVKGFEVLAIMTKRFEVVATNPPYLARRNMNSALVDFLSDQYPHSKGDLYAAFIERCAEFLEEGGRLAMITQQSFMFISSYEKMRTNLLKEHAIETMCHVGPRAFDAISGEKVNTTLFGIRKETNLTAREEAIGNYFRLVKEPDGETKRRRFEAALSSLNRGETDPLVFRYRQGDVDAIPGSPWVYWITAGIRQLFENLPMLQEIAQPRQGLATADNFRFLRYWWEVGQSNIEQGSLDSVHAEISGKKWFPYMKGGGFQRWYGNQDHAVNWQSDGLEIRNIGIETGKLSSRPQNTDFYFRRGVTWPNLTTGRFSARLSPGGFIFDVSGSSAFPEDPILLLAILNSSLCQHLLKIINPTVNFQVGDIARLPVPASLSITVKSLVEQAIAFAKADSAEDETTYDFIAPPDYETGLEDVSNRVKELARIEREIDEEVYRLYGISDEDRAAIEAELAEGMQGESDDNSDLDPENEKSPLIPLYEKGKVGSSPLVKGSERGFSEDATEEIAGSVNREFMAFQWISYAVGMVMGRFEPGLENGVGRRNSPEEVAGRLWGMADPDGILVMDEGYRDDLPARVIQALNLVVGDDAAADVVRAATGKEGEIDDLLRQYLERQFLKLHIQQYRKRPVYWFLQSPRKKYGIWVFHEKLNKDLLYRIRKEYVEPKINLLDSRTRELQEKRDGAEGRKRREIEKEIGKLIEILDDVREFLKRLNFIIEERGYVPHIDDGVLLNMAPLWELIPSWQAEPKKAWEALERGDYDWAYQAMDHWPERVKEKCKTNKSFAIAHGLEEAT